MALLDVWVEIDKQDEHGIWVVPQTRSACSSCIKSTSCAKFTPPSSVLLQQIALQPVQTNKAKLSIESTQLTQASSLVYGLPLCLMLVAAMLSQPLKNDLLSLMCIVLGLVLGVVSARYLQNKYLKNLNIKVNNHLNNQSEIRSECE